MMKRLGLDSTAPRRVTADQRRPHPRPEDAVVMEEAELVRDAWNELRRLSPFL
jgi:hypothetical protein